MASTRPIEGCEGLALRQRDLESVTVSGGDGLRLHAAAPASAPTDDRRRAQVESRVATGAAGGREDGLRASPCAGVTGSSSTIRASPMSRSRRLDVPIETPRHQTPHRHGRRRGERRPVDVLAQDRRERVGNVIALERALTRQHLVEHGAERPHVAPLVGLASLRLLGTHVCGGAKDDAHLRQRRARDRR